MSTRSNRFAGNSSGSRRRLGGRQRDGGLSPSGKQTFQNRFSGERRINRSNPQAEGMDDNSGPFREGPAREKRGSDIERIDRYRYRETQAFSRRTKNENKPLSRRDERWINPEKKQGSRFYQRNSSYVSENPLNKREQEGVFEKDSSSDLIWGRHATQSVLESGRPIHRVWCTSELRSSHKFLQLLKDVKSRGVLVEEVTWARLGQLTNGGVHQGIVLQIASAPTLDLKTLVNGCSALDESPLILALDGLTDPQNLGAIVRSAEALGAHGLVLPQRRSAGLTGSVAKVAAGALEHLPVARVVNLNRSLEELKQFGYRVIGLAEEGDLTLSEVDLEGPLVVVTGSEDKGISLVTRRHCDQLVRIPLRGVTTSLNASVATALLLYEVARRGWMKSLLGQAPSPRSVRAKCFPIND